MGISDVLKIRRKQLNLTLAEIADKVGVTEATVQRWESGNIKNLRQGRIGRLAEVLDVTPAYLMGWDEVNEKFIANDDDELLQALNSRPLLREFVQNLLKMDDDSIKAFLTIVGIKSSLEDK